MDVRQRLGRPLKVAVLCSHRAPGLVPLLNQDRRRGRDYEIVCCVSSSNTFIEEVRVERRGVTCVPHSIRHFCRSRGVELGNLEARVAYDQVTVDLLRPFNPDVLLLDGYLLVLTEPVLNAYDGRILNIHHSDLLLRHALGGTRYPGLRAVRDAMFAGETETRATAHVVTERLDDGPVLLRSWSFPIPPVAQWARERDANDVVKAVAWVHQEWMLREAWPRMLERTIELACRACDDPRTPLAVQRLGQWLLQPDGALAPASELVAV